MSGFDEGKRAPGMMGEHLDGVPVDGRAEDVRRAVRQMVSSMFCSMAHEYFPMGRAMTVSRRITKMLHASGEFEAVIDEAVQLIVDELPTPAPKEKDVPGSVVAFAQGRAR